MITKELQLSVKTEYSSGLKNRKLLAEMFGITITDVRKILRRVDTPNKKHFTDDEKINLSKLYETGEYSFLKLSKIFGRSEGAVCALLKRRGYVAHPMSELVRKYDLNEDFFSKIDSESKAYFLGLLFSDGCNHTPTGFVSIKLQESDKEILEKFKDEIQSTNPLKYTAPKYDGCKSMWSIELNSKKLSSSLSELGCVKAKSLIKKFPFNIPSEHIRHFIRGYFDGNGHVDKHVSICSSLDFCLGLIAELEKHISVTTTLRIKKNNIAEIYFPKKNNFIVFLNFIYSDCCFYIDRKYKKYLLINENLES